MLELMFNTVAVIGFLLLLIFAWLGFKFVAKAFSFATEMALLDWKYEKIKNTTNDNVRTDAFNKLRNNGSKESE
jgi:hypothetical protein